MCSEIPERRALARAMSTRLAIDCAHVITNLCGRDCGSAHVQPNSRTRRPGTYDITCSKIGRRVAQLYVAYSPTQRFFGL
jgi:hypothetical protein